MDKLLDALANAINAGAMGAPAALHGYYVLKAIEIAINAAWPVIIVFIAGVTTYRTVTYCVGRAAYNDAVRLYRWYVEHHRVTDVPEWLWERVKHPPID